MSCNTYTHAFKDKIALLALQGTPIRDLMKEYGVSYTSVTNWKKQYAEKQTQKVEEEEPDPESADVHCRVGKNLQYRNRMKELRLERNLSQTEIGRMIGLEQSAYARYERNEIELPIRNLIKLCKYYGVSSDYMLCLTDKRKYEK